MNNFKIITWTKLDINNGNIYKGVLIILKRVKQTKAVLGIRKLASNIS